MLIYIKNFLLSLPHRIWSLFIIFRDVLSRVLGDPSISADIYGNRLYLPLSHNLPYYIYMHRYYDTALTRISDFIRSKEKGINYIDVGANIGDSIVAIRPQDSDTIIGIEPDRKFEKFLSRNLKHFENVLIENVICSSVSDHKNYRIDEKNGTARIIEDLTSDLARTETIDNLVKQHHFKNVNLIKVDTDGHDLEVLNGSTNTIKKFHPSIFFECDSFEDKDYEKKFFEFFDFLSKYGYKTAILYDNFGYLYSHVNLKDKAVLQNALYYQTHSEFYYFDILVMKESYLTEFLKKEKSFWEKQNIKTR